MSKVLSPIAGSAVVKRLERRRVDVIWGPGGLYGGHKQDRVCRERLAQDFEPFRFTSWYSKCQTDRIFVETNKCFVRQTARFC